MYLHANAKLGLAARLALVRAIEAGCSIRSAARRFNVSPATAHRWWQRWREAGEETRASLACRSFEPSAAQPARARAGVAGGDLRLPAPDWLGSAPGRGGDRLRPLDRLKGALSGGDLAARAGREGAC